MHPVLAHPRDLTPQIKERAPLSNTARRAFAGFGHRLMCAICFLRARMHTWEQPWPSKTPKKWCLPEEVEPRRKSGLMDTASSISRRRPNTEVTPYLGHHLDPNSAPADGRHGPAVAAPAPARAPATLCRLPQRATPASASSCGGSREPAA
ncbi:Os05g0457300, partial [Oryza sativa Japonica Group]